MVGFASFTHYYPFSSIPGFKPTDVKAAVQTYCSTDATLCNTKHPQGDSPIKDWDVSDVTYFRAAFVNLKEFNDDISKWDMSKATMTEIMFFQCSKFTGDISKWDVSKVMNTQAMFKLAHAFNGDLSKWDARRQSDGHGQYA